MTSLCILPLSSPYALLPRVHLYATTLALLAPLPKGWLFRAALASFTTKTATLAIDAIVQLAALRSRPPRHHGPLPLELVVTMEMLGLACLVATWLLLVSRTASISAARSLMRGWAAAAALGAIVSFVAVRELAAAAAAASPPSSCPHGRLVPSSDVLGDERVSLPGVGTVGVKMRDILLIVGIPTLLSSSLTLLSITAKGHRPASLLTEAALASAAAASPEVTHVRNASGFAAKAARIIRVVLTCAIPALVVVVVHRTETYLFGSNAPEGEPLSSVGQWGIWAATGVVLLGTAVNAAREAFVGREITPVFTNVKAGIIEC